jgi:lipoprotein-anchoring transpeptidase ErfK/SrfK
MRTCVLAFCAIALAGCSAGSQLGELSYAVELPKLPPLTELTGSASAPAVAAPKPGDLDYALVTSQTADAGPLGESAAPQVAEASAAQVAALPAPEPAKPGDPQPPANAVAESDAVPADYTPDRPSHPENVKLKGYAPGTVVVRTGERRLYYVLEDGRALRYMVGVGKGGMKWTGKSFINSKRFRPPWSPPQMMVDENPSLPAVIPSGSPANPMGDAALLIAGGEYAIHGTNRRETIGHFVSHGCIRMFNEDVMDLYHRVSLGTPVVVER